MKEAIELALKTWYSEGHDLHFDLHHPLGKLLGEWGELLDDHMKMLYKPKYEWNALNEMGDIWYYLRILAYQRGHSLTHENNTIFIVTVFNQDIILPTSKIDDIIGVAMYFSLKAKFKRIDSTFFSVNYSVLWELCNRFDLTLEQLTELNWQKLKPGSERGEEWMKAR